MGTCPDWHPLAEADPLPGDPGEVRALAGRYLQAAEWIGAQSTALARVRQETSWSGAAAGAFQGRMRPLGSDLAAVAERFQRVAQALREFAPALESAQRRASAALSSARAAQQRAGITPGSAPDPFADVVAATSMSAARAAEEEIRRARRAVRAACDERDQAAARCLQALHAAGDDRLRDPHGWHRVLEVVSGVAGHLSTWFGVAALALCWVPGVGQILGAATLTAALVALVSDAALAGYGEKGRRALLIDGLGVVPAGRMLRAAAAVPHSAGALRAVGRSALPQVGQDVRFGARDFGASVGAVRAARPSGARRQWSTFVGAPGGLAHELRLADVARGERGLSLVTGGYAVDVVHSELSAAQELGLNRDSRQRTRTR